MNMEEQNTQKKEINNMAGVLYDKDKEKHTLFFGIIWNKENKIVIISLSIIILIMFICYLLLEYGIIK